MTNPDSPSPVATSDGSIKRGPTKAPTIVDLFDVALRGADNAMPVLIAMLKTANLKGGLVVADEIWANVKCALKVYREQREDMIRFAAAQKESINPPVAPSREEAKEDPRIADEVRKVMAKINQCATLGRVPVSECPSLFAFGPIYDLVIRERAAVSRDTMTENDQGAELIHQPIPDMADTEPRPSIQERITAWVERHGRTQYGDKGLRLQMEEACAILEAVSAILKSVRVKV